MHVHVHVHNVHNRDGQHMQRFVLREYLYMSLARALPTFRISFPNKFPVRTVLSTTAPYVVIQVLAAGLRALPCFSLVIYVVN